MEPKFHYLAPVPLLTQVGPVHVLSSYIFKIHFNIILPPMPKSSA